MEAFFADYLERLRWLDSHFIATFDDLPDEALDWAPGDEMNTFTILVVHTTAAARYWIGDVGLGESSNRNRAAEFQAKGLSKVELKARFEAVETYVEAKFATLTLADLATVQPITNKMMDRDSATVGWALLHALEHTALHLGHAQMTRQLWQQR